MFDFLSIYYALTYACIQNLKTSPPPITKKEKETIAQRIKDAMAETVDLGFWSVASNSSPPEDSDCMSVTDVDEVPASKRMRLSEEGSGGEVCDTGDAIVSKAVRGEDNNHTGGQAAETLLTVRCPEVQMQTESSSV
jgi:hypothetical protein